MVRYNNLYPKIYELSNIELAYHNARKGKLYYDEVKMIDSEPSRYFKEIHQILKNKTFINSEYEVFTKVTDNGKTREIYKLPYFPDRIIHHCIIQMLEPIWIKTMITDTYACIKGRGMHKCVKKLKRVLRDEPRYCLKLDVKKFYQSIDHGVLKQIIRRKIKDQDVLWLLDQIIDSAPGIPIGNYLSQYFGNLYLSGFDHWMKEDIGCKNYYRYCDDIVILGNSKSELHSIQKAASDYLHDKLNLKMKSNWQVFPTESRGIDFLGYRFFFRYTLLRKSIIKKIKKRIKFIRKNWEHIKINQIVNSIMSYYGWMKHANCLNFMKKYFDKELFSIMKITCRKAGIRNPLQGKI